MRLSRRNSGCCGHVPSQRNNHDKAVPFHGLLVRLLVLSMSRVYEVWARTNEHELLVVNKGRCGSSWVAWLRPRYKSRSQHKKLYHISREVLKCIGL
ncbi:hypothetical protein Tco_0249442, partial [Tanacetum coccineum]